MDESINRDTISGGVDSFGDPVDTVTFSEGRLRERRVVFVGVEAFIEIWFGDDVQMAVPALTDRLELVDVVVHKSLTRN